jgi:hypothetical protein
VSEGVVSGSQSFSQLKTLAQLRSLVYAPLRDTERSFVESWFVDSLLNEAYLDLNARLRLNQETDTGTTSATGTITYPSDLVEVTNLWVTDDAGTAIHVFVVENEKFKSWAEPAASSPHLYIARLWNGVIETYPALESLDYELEFIGRPASMELDTDTPSVLDPEMQPRLVAYARAHAKWQEGEIQEGNQYMAQYEQGLPGSPRMTNKVRPASLTLIPEPGPFG